MSKESVEYNVKLPDSFVNGIGLMIDKMAGLNSISTEIIVPVGRDFATTDIGQSLVAVVTIKLRPKGD